MGELASGLAMQSLMGLPPRRTWTWVFRARAERVMAAIGRGCRKSIAVFAPKRCGVKVPLIGTTIAALRGRRAIFVAACGPATAESISTGPGA